MAYLVGVVVAVIVCVFATIVGLDRDRAFYPTLLIVIALYYALFAAIGAAPGAMAAESIPIAGFILLAILGFKWNPWFLVVGLAGHGVFDFAHAGFITDPGVPPWWPPFCLACDVVMAVYVAALILMGRLSAASAQTRVSVLHGDHV
jgi:hypothetical protein